MIIDSPDLDLVARLEATEAALREFTEWFAERFPTGQNVSLPGARLYSIYLHAVAALPDESSE